MQLVLLLDVHVASKDVHFAVDGAGGVEGAGSRPHRRFVGSKPGLLVALQHRQIIQGLFAEVNAPENDLQESRK